MAERKPKLNKTTTTTTTTTTKTKNKNNVTASVVNVGYGWFRQWQRIYALTLYTHVYVDMLSCPCSSYKFQYMIVQLT